MVKDPRNAAVHEPPPTGDGKIVLDYVNEKIRLMYEIAVMPTALGSLIPAKGLQLLGDDLRQRAEMGHQKYGTYLRINNGRNATVDLYQEVCDSIMYASQARMEGKPAGQFVELFINIASQLALQIEHGN